MQISFSGRAQKALRSLDGVMKQRILDAIERYALDPERPKAAKRLTNRNAARLRVGDYRVVFSVSQLPDGNAEMVIQAVDHRRDIYNRI